MLIRVLEIPKSNGKFCFGGGNPQTWIEVDWFRDNNRMMETESGREEIEKFIKHKNYFNPEKSYLVLHQNHTFTIGYFAE